MKQGEARSSTTLACAIDQIREHLPSVVPWIDGLVNARDFTRLINQDADALGIASRRIGAGAVCESEGPLGVAQQRKIKIVLLGESVVLLNAIEAGAKNRNVVLIESGFLIAEPATFDRSARGIGLGVEPEQNFLAA